MKNCEIQFKGCNIDCNMIENKIVSLMKMIIIVVFLL